MSGLQGREEGGAKADSVRGRPLVRKLELVFLYEIFTCPARKDWHRVSLPRIRY